MVKARSKPKNNLKMENKEKVAPGKFVAYSYKLYNDADNSLLFEASREKPDVMVFGVSNEVVPGLTGVMEGLSTGDRFGVTLPPATAFGDRYPENVVELERDIFVRDGKLAPGVEKGAELPMMTQDGMMIKGKVIEITDSNVKMDFNHPFAGLTVRFEGEIEEVRDATPEEIHPVSGCSCGCHGGCGSDEGSCDCHHGDCGSEGCNCGDEKGCGCNDNCDCGDDCHCDDDNRCSDDCTCGK